MQEAIVKALQKVEDLYAKQTAAGPYFVVRFNAFLSCSALYGSS